MTNYITKRFQVIFSYVFKDILAFCFLTEVHPGLPRTFVVEIMPDEVILDHKKSYLVNFENFHFL
jgi:hypothetical protein